ncbi:MAG: SDR family NAD(P)-dependent oxidoreductase [Candidatus Entotheonellia bacterium]
MSGALDLFRLDERVAVVTGGSKGIGMFYSQALAEAGANVVVADIDPQSVAETSERLSKEHEGRILAADLDVTSRQSIRAMLHQIDQRWGRLDILVHNAALFSAIPRRESPWDIPDDEFDRVMLVNVRAIYRCTAECLPLMQRHHWGRVINISSGLAFKGSAGLMHYAASKGAVVNLTRSMAAALGDTGITVNSIAPGSTASPTLRAVQPNAGVEAVQRRLIKRLEVPDDLVGTLLYLASPASDFLTGQTIVVNGGDYLH